MSGGRWREVTATFHRVLERPPDERSAWLAAACAEDAWLRDQVSTLLASYDHAADTSSFAAEVMEAMAAAPPSALAAGARLGRYEVEAPLGAGGMGAVFAARDVTLGRRVALKVLPGHLAADPVAMARFQQEARLASALNHPNIVTVYEIGAADGVPFIATELIEGDTLRAHIVPAGRDAAVVLPIAAQVASALAAAHQAGVVHRDVKPENVMVRPDGLVKVLDFGLAKPERAGEPSLATAPGLVMGTVSYMSPEQARGQEVDARSDVWSLGVVLYEMLAGRAPFAGASTADVLVALLEREPAPLPASAGALAGVVMRCLAKDRAERYRTAGELLEALRAPAVPRARRALGASARPWTLAACAATLAAMFGLGLPARGARSSPPAAAPAPVSMTPLTHNGKVTFAAASRDGAWLAYVMEESNQSSAWVQRLGGEQPLELIPPATAEYRGLSFSPDGRFVYVTADFEGRDVFTLYRVPRAGGPRETVLTGAASGATFSPDGARLTFVRRVSPSQTALVVSAADGGGERPLLTTTAPELLVEVAPAWSPDGRTIAATHAVVDPRTGTALEVLAVDAAGGAARPLGGRRWRWAGSPLWVGDGSGVLVPVAGTTSTSGQIVRLPYPEGAAVEVTRDVNSYLAVAGTGDPTRFIALRRELISSVWVAEPGGAAAKVTRGEGKYFYNLAWTHDGRIVCSSDESGNWNLLALDPATRNAQRLTSGPFIDAAPDVTDNGQVVFQSTRGGNRNLWAIGMDGSGLRQITFGGGEYNPQAAPKGWVAYTSYDGGAASPWRVPLGGGAPVRLSDAVLRDPTVSPDGRWIAGHYQAHEGAPWRIGILAAEGPAKPARPVALPGAGAAWQVVRWIPGSDALSYIESSDDVHNLWSWAPGRAPRPLTHFDSGRIFAYAWSRDGHRLALIRGVYNRDVVEVRTQ